MMPKSAIKVTGIDHIVLFVHDLEVSKRFYMDVLGFWSPNKNAGSSNGRPNQRAAYLRCDGPNFQTLDLNEIEGDVHGGEEMSHMAFNIESGDREGIIAELAKFGITVHGRNESDIDTVHIYDPDGHRIQLYLPSEQQDKRERHTRDRQSVNQQG